MRLSDLLDVLVIDSSLEEVGRVHDVLLTQDGPMLGDEASFRIEGVIVGRGALGTRLGYVRTDMSGPWLIKCFSSGYTATLDMSHGKTSLRSPTIRLSLLRRVMTCSNHQGCRPASARSSGLGGVRADGNDT